MSQLAGGMIFPHRSPRFHPHRWYITSTNASPSSSSSPPPAPSSREELLQELDRINEEIEQLRAEGGGEAGEEYKNPKTGEVGGPRGPEPTRYGDYAFAGKVTDF